MILSEYVKIKVHSKIISKLRKNGYVVKIGDIISIKVIELSPNSHVSITVWCF